MMARGLVDEMSYNDKSNEVRLIKYFSPRDSLCPNMVGTPN